MHDKNTVAHGPRAVSAHPAAQISTKRLMLLIEARARDTHLNKAVRHLRLESSHHDVLVRPSQILAKTVLRRWPHSMSLNHITRDTSASCHLELQRCAQSHPYSDQCRFISSERRGMRSGLYGRHLMQQISTLQKRPSTPLWPLEETTQQMQVQCRGLSLDACFALDSMD